MKPKLAVGVSCFQSVHELPRLLNPIYKHVDQIYVIDGKYVGFEYPVEYSNDGTDDLLKQYDNVVHIKFTGTQIDKRNKYLEYAEKDNMDHLITLDSDDYLHQAKIYQKWDKLYKQFEKRKDELLMNMWFWLNPLWEKNWNVVQDNTWGLYTRVIKPSQVRYAITHWCFINVDEPDSFIMPESRPLEHVRFNSDSTLRTKDYIKRGFDWAKWNTDEENERMNKAGKMTFNYWKRQLDKAMSLPGTVVVDDQTNTS